MSARHILDRVQSLTAIAALEAEPECYAVEVVAELPPDVETRDAALADALRHIDETATRVMRIQLEHGADAIPLPTRRVFAATVVSYEHQLPLLCDRVLDVARRARIASPEGVAAAAVDGARATLALRTALRTPLLAAIRDSAAAAIADADRQARDRTLDDVQRKRWSAVRRELEAVASDAARILTAAFGARVAAWPEQIDEPDPQAEPTFADMIEID